MNYKYRFRPRRDDAINWFNANPVLGASEIAIENGDPVKFKIGDGVTPWNSLPYIGESSPTVGPPGPQGPVGPPGPQGEPLSTGNLVFINTISDLPSPVGGVIFLDDNKTYFFTGNIDLAGNRLVCGSNTALVGGSSENTIISSTGLIGQALISSSYSLPMRSLSISADTALNLNALSNPGSALDWFGVNFLNCNSVGLISNYNNFIASDCGWLNSSGMIFDGTIGTVGFSQCIFDSRNGGTIINLPSTLTITRRFRIIYSAFIVLSGETGVNCNTSASIPVEGYILDTVNFSGGGNYIVGIQHSDNKSLFVNNRGISNSSEVSYFTMINNSVVTSITNTTDAVKILGTTIGSNITQKFTNSNNRTTYIGAISRSFKVEAILSCNSGNNNQVLAYIAKNGSIIPESEGAITVTGTGRAEQAVTRAVVELSTNDFIEVFIRNSSSANNITVTELSLIVQALN